MSDPKALLLVFSEVGSNLSENEYNDWYDNEHVPLRVKTPSFLSWARFIRIDDEKPSYAAYYDLESREATLVPPYSLLAENRSEREKSILGKIGAMDRRVYEVHPDQSFPASPAFDPKKGPAYTVLVETDVRPEDEENFDRWYEEEHIPMLAQVPGWLRSRRFILKEESCFGTDQSKRVMPPPKHLAIHEWASQEKLDSDAYALAVNTPWRNKIHNSAVRKTRREFELYRAWTRDDCSAADQFQRSQKYS